MFAPTNRNTQEALSPHILATPNTIPTAFLGLALCNGKVRSFLLHWVSTPALHPFEPSPWDGCALAFIGNVLPGNYIEIVKVTQLAFDLPQPQTTPSIAQLDASFAIYLAINFVPALPASAPNTTLMSVRLVMPVPPCLSLQLTLAYC